MAFDPVKGHLMALDGFVQSLPQIDVFNGLFIGRFPAIALPAMHPLRDALFDILAVGPKIDRAGALERFKAHNGGHQFHAVIGREFLAAIQRFACLAIDHQDTPTAGARIAGTRAIGEEGDAIGGCIIAHALRAIITRLLRGLEEA